MKSQWKSGKIVALVCTLSLSDGCQSLPWLGNRKHESAMTVSNMLSKVLPTFNMTRRSTSTKTIGRPHKPGFPLLPVAFPRVPHQAEAVATNAEGQLL